MAETGSGEKVKIFISYSRRDSNDFAEELVAGLELAGFAPFLDRHDIAPGEPWEDRLSGLIQQADTVVYVISPEAVKSERCGWEVEKTLALSKRLLPIVFKPVPEAEIPEQLRKLQFVRFDAGPGITRPLAQLADALRQDLDWIREHTRLGELARRWETRGHPEALVLRGDDLAAALSWADRRKPDAPTISDLMRAYLAASKATEAVSLAKSKAIQRHIRWMRAFAVLCALGVVAALAGWWKQDWLTERIYVWRNVNAFTAAQEKALKRGDLFNECTDCPEMIVVPAGSFMMGSPGEPHVTQFGTLQDFEDKPLHRVTIGKPLAVAKFELTFGEWNTCTAHGDCIPRVSDNGWGRGRQPVINVNWNDAQMYVAWLSKVTGKHYRLLTEAEYEYATRAGTVTPYYWGDEAGYNNANCQDCQNRVGKRTAPVGSFAPNAFGLYDMVGNVLEWTEDCYHEDYKGAPTDGTAWTSGEYCNVRMCRGGGFDVFNQMLTSSYRYSRNMNDRNNTLGFRVARTLDVP